MKSGFEQEYSVFWHLLVVYGAQPAQVDLFFSLAAAYDWLPVCANFLHEKTFSRMPRGIIHLRGDHSVKHVKNIDRFCPRFFLRLDLKWSSHVCLPPSHCQSCCSPPSTGQSSVQSFSPHCSCGGQSCRYGDCREGKVCHGFGFLLQSCHYLKADRTFNSIRILWFKGWHCQLGNRIKSNSSVFSCVHYLVILPLLPSLPCENGSNGEESEKENCP